jgi:hypothetical protein
MRWWKDMPYQEVQAKIKDIPPPANVPTITDDREYPHSGLDAFFRNDVNDGKVKGCGGCRRIIGSEE